ncbi:MAG TPA: hypothetical protein VG943_10365 [Caulobacterales bacterium]|nr:hypothetical protein [Caulobacterales bacterium]
MNWMKTGVLAMALAFCAAPAFAQGVNNLSGVWQGVFWGAGNTPTSFQITLRDDPGPGFSGSTVETNNFGDVEAPFLLATLQGQVQGAQVSFVKTYDGTGSVSHSVSYRGRLVSDRRIVGTWSLDGASGPFEMAR